MSIEASDLIKEAENYYENGIYEGAIDKFKRVYSQNPDLLTEENKEHFAKAIYEFNIRDSTFMTTELDASLILLTRLVSQKDTREGQECIYTDSVMTFISNKRDYEAILKWYKKINPKLLNPNPDKKNSYSYKDKYYSNTTRALLNEKHYKKCIDLSKEALEEIDYIMNEDEAWFKVRIAKASMNISNFDEAIKYFKEAIKAKENWSNKYAFADCYYVLGDYDNALKQALDAALTDPKIRPLLKINLYQLLSELLNEKGYENEIDYLDNLINAIKFDNKEIADEDDEEYLECISELEDGIDVKSMEENLRPIWRKILSEL